MQSSLTLSCSSCTSCSNVGSSEPNATEAEAISELGEGLASGTPAHRRIVGAVVGSVACSAHALVLGGLFVGGRMARAALIQGEPVLVAEVADKRCHVKGMVLGRHGVRDDFEGLYRGVRTPLSSTRQRLSNS